MTNINFKNTGFPLYIELFAIVTLFNFFLITLLLKKSKKETLEDSSNNIDHLMPLQNNADLHAMNGEPFEIPNTESDAKKIIQAR